MSEFIEFGSMEAADRAREEHAEYRCPIDDDRRQKTVAFVSDTPESLLQRIEAEATEDRSAANQRSNTATLTDRERDKISKVDGFSQSTTTANWRSAKGVFETAGLGDQFRDAIGYLTDYDDPAEGAEQYVREYQQGGQGGGARDSGEEDITGRQREANAAAREQEEGCDHARDVCRHGEPEACEFLTDACGYDPDKVDEILGAEESAADADPDEITGEAAGALSRSWSGYKGAIAELGEALDSAREAWENAQQAAEAINGIRGQHAQDAMHFDALEVANADLLDLTRMAAADCHECHADHSDHDHAVTSGELEDLREFVGDGAASTPVGTSENTNESLAELSDEQLAEREPGRPDPAGMDTDPEGPAAPIDASPNRLPETVPAVPRAEMLRDTSLAPSDFDPTIGRSRPEGKRAQRRHRERLDAVAAADAAADADTPDGSEQFATEKQGTLGVNVASEEAAEEKQVTLTGADEADSPGALPNAWETRDEWGGRYDATRWDAGPYRVVVSGADEFDTTGPFNVTLSGPENTFTVASGIKNRDRAVQIGAEFTERVAPPDVSFHRGDSTLPEAAAQAKRAASATEGGLSEFA